MQIRFKRCPRCEEEGLEVLETYSHCVNCLFVDDPTFKVPMKNLKKLYGKEKTDA